jgi:hypothetical protein
MVTGATEFSTIFTAIGPSANYGGESYACRVARDWDHRSPLDQMVVDAPTSLAEAWWRCLYYKLDIPMTALVPPVALLVLGYAIAWAINGFRTRRNPP